MGKMLRLSAMSAKLRSIAIGAKTPIDCDRCEAQIYCDGREAPVDITLGTMFGLIAMDVKLSFASVISK